MRFVEESVRSSLEREFRVAVDLVNQAQVIVGILDLAEYAHWRLALLRRSDCRFAVANFWYLKEFLFSTDVGREVEELQDVIVLVGIEIGPSVDFPPLRDTVHAIIYAVKFVLVIRNTCISRIRVRRCVVRIYQPVVFHHATVDTVLTHVLIIIEVW